MIKFDSEKGELEINGNPRLLAAECTFIIKEIYEGMTKKSPLAAMMFKFAVNSSMELCFLTEEQRKQKLQKEMEFGELLSNILKEMSKKEEKKKPDVSADFMSDEEFHSFFDKLRGEDE